MARCCQGGLSPAWLAFDTQGRCCQWRGAETRWDCLDTWLEHCLKHLERGSAFQKMWGNTITKGFSKLHIMGQYSLNLVFVSLINTNKDDILQEVCKVLLGHHYLRRCRLSRSRREVSDQRIAFDTFKALPSPEGYLDDHCRSWEQTPVWEFSTRLESMDVPASQ